MTGPGGGAAAAVDRATAPRRLHPLAPLARLWTVVVLLAFVVVRDQGGTAQVRSAGVVLVGGAVVAVMLVVLALSYLTWWRTSFWFDGDGDFRLASGVVSTRLRRVQLSRLQAVDLVRPLPARVLGLAELRLDVAGGRATKVRLAYLGHDDAEALRAELLARAAGVVHEVPGAPAREAPEDDARDGADRQLVLAVLLGGPMLVAVLVVVAAVALAAATRQAGLLLTLVVLVLGPVTVVVREFTTYFGFTLAESPDGLRTRHGLVETRAQRSRPDACRRSAPASRCCGAPSAGSGCSSTSRATPTAPTASARRC